MASSAAADSKSHRSGFSFLSCFGFSGEAKPIDRKKSSKDGILRRRKMSGRRFSFSSDTSSIAVQPTGSDSSGSVKLPISSGQDTAALLESSQFEKPKEEGKVEDQIIECDVASTEEDKCQVPSSITSSNCKLTPVTFSRSLSLPAPPKREMETSAALSTSRKINRGGYGGGLFIAALTLVVMIVWGKICAIVCVSCFLYLFPLLTDSGSGDGKLCGLERESNDVVDDDDDDELRIKKKREVVLKGFLDRSRRRSSFGNC